ncbi:MAG: hypothetical protein ACYSUD_03685, partial [Planctomycetota bacterium]
MQGWEYLAFSSPSASQPCFLYFQANRNSCFCRLDREIMAFLEILPKEHQHFRVQVRHVVSKRLDLVLLSLPGVQALTIQNRDSRFYILLPFWRAPERSYFSIAPFSDIIYSACGSLAETSFEM